MQEDDLRQITYLDRSRSESVRVESRCISAKRDFVGRGTLKSWRDSSVIVERVLGSASRSKNYHLGLGEDRTYYSVAYKHGGKRIDVIYPEKLVEIFGQWVRIAVHTRMDKYGQKGSMCKERMPDKHEMY